MAARLGIFSQMMWGEWADRDAINKNADALESVEAGVSSLQKSVARQAQEILRLRAMIEGLVELLQNKVPFDDAELELAVSDAWARLSPPPPAPRKAQEPASTDPYRDAVPAGEPTADEIAAAKALLRVAEEHHFSKRFADARTTYQQIVDRHGNTKQAIIARQQIENLRGS
jgi:TolA-binding protein